MAPDSPRDRVLAALSGLGLSPLEVIDALAEGAGDVVIRLMEDGGKKMEIVRATSVAAELLLLLRGQTAEAHQALLVLLLAIRQITGEAKERGMMTPTSRKGKLN